MASTMPAPKQGKVKSVLSGDSVVIGAIGNSSLERTFSLAHVSAPRMKREGDEPFAFESRDFIRHLVGKVIQFRVLYTVPSTNREYGTITLREGAILPDICVQEGWVKLREEAEKRAGKEDEPGMLDRLQGLQARAKAEGKGIWGSTVQPAETSDVSDTKDFASKHKGSSLDGVVEKVLTGDRVIVRIIESPTSHVQTMVLLAGVRAPATKKSSADGTAVQQGEPFGDDALRFVEERMSQRNVKIQILGLSPQNQLVANLLHPAQGNIAKFLLDAGLARCHDHHSTMLGPEMSSFRQSEKAAREGGRGLWQNVAKRAANGSQTDVVVTRVQNAETLFVRLPNGNERRISLSSIRQPKPTDPKQAPFSADSKEQMRRLLIGKHVKVSIDGKKPAEGQYEERELATVVVNAKNVAVTAAENGWVSVLRHKMDDTDRSPDYDALLVAEDSAQKDGKGMWAAKPPEAKAYVDYSENLEKAKRLTSILSRQRRVPAIVDYVKGGSRFTLLIPKENAKITLVLSGVQVPRSARNSSDAAEPFGQEAHDLANKRLNQRDVEIDVEDNDKVGGFIGKLYINRENFAKLLLEEGYGSVRQFSAERSGNLAELQAAEQKAKEARKGIWHDYDPAQELAEENDEDDDTNGARANGGAAANGAGDDQTTPSTDYRDVVITYVDPASCTMKLQQISAATTGALDSLMAAFRSFHVSSSSSLSDPPKAGDVVAAKFSVDGNWYRARIRRNDRENKTAEVLYIDYGNSESLPWTKLRPLGAADRFGLQKLKPQALDAKLSFVQFPYQNTDYMRDAAQYLHERCCADGRQLVARVDFADTKDNTLNISLFEAPSAGGGSSSKSAPDTTMESSINGEIVEEGLAMCTRKPMRWERAQAKMMSKLKELEGYASNEHRGIWEYGDITADD